MSTPTHRIFRALLALVILFSALPLSVGRADPGAGVTLFLPFVISGAPQNPTGAASSSVLIQKALESGQIDYPTSLRYRAYAWFEDPRLPKAYWGSGPSEDLGLFDEIQNPAQALDAATLAELAAFTARPDDPASVFNAHPSGAQEILDPDASGAALACDALNWATLAPPDPSMKVRLHAQCVGNYEKDLNFVLGILQAHYGDMVALMGPPLPDAGGAKAGGTPDIDFYLVNPIDTIPRQYPPDLNGSDRHGLAPFDDPFVGNQSSGYVLLKRDLLYSPFMVDVIVHEFFHVLQYAHNEKIFFKNRQEWWFGEATATWAQSHFLKETALQHVHFPQFLAHFRSKKVSLGLAAPYGSEEQPLLYAQYMWALFLEQELGPQAIAQAWKNLQGTTDWFLGMDQIGKVLSFETNFRRFTQRNLNLGLGPGEGVITPRYKDLNSPPASFPDNLTPIPEAEQENLPPRTRQDAPTSYQTSLPSLRAAYYHFSFEQDANKVLLDLTPLNAYGNIQVDAVVQDWNGDWKIEPVALGNVELCEIREIWLIVNNTELDYRKSTDIEFSMLPITESCACEAVAQALNKVDHFEFQLAVNYTQSASHNDESLSVVYDYNVATPNMQQTHMTPFSAGYLGGTFTGAGSVNRTYTHQKRVATTTGSGLPVPYDAASNNHSRITLHYDLERCTYNFNATIYVMASSNEGNGPFEFNVGSVGSGRRPANESLTFSGSETWQGHTPEYILVQPDIFDFYSVEDFEFLMWLGEENLGDASVSWSIRPVFKTGP